jgi:hypothetical protein
MLENLMAIYGAKYNSMCLANKSNARKICKGLAVAGYYNKAISVCDEQADTYLVVSKAPKTILRQLEKVYKK